MSNIHGMRGGVHMLVNMHEATFLSSTGGCVAGVTPRPRALPIGGDHLDAFGAEVASVTAMQAAVV